MKKAKGLQSIRRPDAGWENPRPTCEECNRTWSVQSMTKSAKFSDRDKIHTFHIYLSSVAAFLILFSTGPSSCVSD